MSTADNKAVFLSYASQDAEAAKRICDILRTAGVEVWFDADGGLEHGDEWDAKIRRQIKECVLFIPVISANTQAREEGYFRIEWDLAAERARGIASGVAFILPIVIDDTREPAALVPDRFRSVQWTRLRGGEVSPEVLQRFLKLWSHRAGVLKHAAQGVAQASSLPSAQDAGWKPARPRMAGRRIVVAAGTAAMLLGWGVYWWLTHPGSLTVAATPAGPAQTASPAEPAPASDERSVAVLAFENLSDDKTQEYFSDGVSEELLTVLQKIPGLRVAARMSSFSFKGKNATAPEIGRTLGVANLVDGSVQKAGNRVKVTVRLSRAATGEELWSDSYTRELKDVFALQNELATAIVGELRGKLGVVADIAAVKAAVKGGTNNPEAHQQYLQGRFHQSQFSVVNLNKAIGCFERATALDPDFALAWAALSRAHAMHVGWADRLTRAEFDEELAEARRTADRALALEPDLPEALGARFEIQFNYDFDWKAGAATMRQALALAPSDPALLSAASRVAGIFGDRSRANELARQAVAVDPVNAEMRVYLGLALIQDQRWAEARSEFARVAELSPTTPWAYAGTGYAFLYEGKYAEAIAAAKLETTVFARLLVEAIGLWGLHRQSEADAALAQLVKEDADVGAFQIAEVYAFRGDKDQAFAWLERAHRQRDAGLSVFPNDAFFDGLRPDPRWAAFQRSLGLAPDQLK